MLLQLVAVLLVASKIVTATALPGALTSEPPSTPAVSSDGLSDADNRRLPYGWGRREDNLYVTEQVGEPHGTPFTDKDYVNSTNGHRRIAKVTLAGCEKKSHVSYLHFGFRDNSLDDDDRIPTGSGHGTFSEGQTVIEHYLEKTEYIWQVQLTTWKAKVGFRDYRTRIGWIRIILSSGINWECGAKDDGDPYYEMKKDFYGLLYMSGSAGKALDALTGHFVKMQNI